MRQPNVTWAWITARDDRPGREWCRACIADETWANGVKGGALADDERSCGYGAGPPGGPSPLWLDAIEESGRGSCPLSGRGEKGAEHLVIWCPAAAEAWTRWGGTERKVWQTIRDGGELLAHLAKLLHQASFLNCTMRGATALEWRTAAGWLVRACARYETGRTGEEEDDMDASDEDDSGLADQDG